MFWNSKFDGDISKWDTSNVRYMRGMFYSSVFSGDISNWNTNRVEDMDYMFEISPLEGKEPEWYEINSWSSLRCEKQA